MDLREISKLQGGTIKNMRQKSVMLLATVVGLTGVLWTGVALARLDYGACVERCEGKVVRVVAEDTGCNDSLQKTAHDVLLLRTYLQTDLQCAGRFRQACDDFKTAAVKSLNAIADSIGSTPNCATANVAAMKEHLWLLSPAEACAGDGAFTDLHDFFRNRDSEIQDLNSRDIRHRLTYQDLTGYEDLGNHGPICEGNLKPINRIVRTFLDMYLFLESLEQYQVCMKSCKKPTPEEEALWTVQDKVDELITQCKAQMDRLNEDETKRQEEEIEKFTTTFPCNSYGRVFAKLKKTLDQLRELKKGAAELETAGAPKMNVVEGVRGRTEEAEKVIRQVNVERVNRNCKEEAVSGRQLEDRKRSVLDSITNSEACSLEAVEVFAVGGVDGQACKWTGECAIPGVCSDGKCVAPVPADRVSDAIDEARKIVREARDFKVMTDKGLAADAERTVKQLEARQKQMVKKLEDRGWRRAVEAWREDYRKSLLTRLESIEGEAQALVAEAEGEDGAERPPVKCRRNLRKVKGTLDDLERVREAVEKSDPILNARWVNLKSQELDDISDKLDSLKAELANHCGDSEAEGGLPWLPVGLGGGLLLLLLVVGLVVWKKRS